MVRITRIFDLLPHLQKICKTKQDIFSHSVNGQWERFSVDNYTHTSYALAQFFQATGYMPGDRVITIIGNRFDWNCIDMGLMLAGLIHVPVYRTLSLDTTGLIIRDAMPVMIIIEDPGLAERVDAYCKRTNQDIAIYSMHAASGIRHYNELLEKALKTYDSNIKLPGKNISPDNVATIIYTSGTTGIPKGVMLTHGNIVSNFLAIAPISGYGTKHKAMSFLPLCHIYERTLIYMYQYLGMSICYATPLERAGEMLREVRPHVFCAVPRFLEKAWSRFTDAGYDKPWPVRDLFSYALRLAANYESTGNNGIWYRFRLMVVRSLVFRKLRKRMGSRLEIIVSGSAALQPRLARGFWAAGIKVIEGYGLTETSPVIAVNRKTKNQFKIGTVGPVIDDTLVKISDEGEILCKGPGIMKGYWNNPELTSEVIDEDGWLHTGDIGEWEAGGFLRIIDRKKELIKTSGGKYISPQQIESLFGESPFFDQVMVIGEGKKFPAAIISPDFNALQNWCRQNSISPINRLDILAKQEIGKLLNFETEKYNQRLGKFERIKRFLFITESWSPETGELSPTLKLRRNAILEKYSRAIDVLYDE